MDAPVWCDSNETVKILLTFSGAAVRQGFSCSLKIIATNCRVGGSLLKALSFESTMNLARTVCLACCLFALQGCFDNSGNETKDNTDGTKSSVQMQESGAEKK